MGMEWRTDPAENRFQILSKKKNNDVNNEQRRQKYSHSFSQVEVQILVFFLKKAKVEG